MASLVLAVSFTNVAAVEPPVEMPPCPDVDGEDACRTVEATADAVAAEASAASVTAEQTARAAMLATPLIVWTDINDGADSGLDADKLDGYSSEDVFARDDAVAATVAALAARLPSVHFVQNRLSHAATCDGNHRQLGTLTLTVHVDGPALLDVSSHANGYQSGGWMATRIFVDGSTLPHVMSFFSAAGWHTHSLNSVVPVEAGDHTVSLLYSCSTSGTWDNSGALTVRVHPL